MAAHVKLPAQAQSQSDIHVDCMVCLLHMGHGLISNERPMTGLLLLASDDALT